MVGRYVTGLGTVFARTVKNDPGSTPRAFFLKRSNSSVSDGGEDDGVGLRRGGGRLVASDCSLSEGTIIALLVH